MVAHVCCAHCDAQVPEGGAVVTFEWGNEGSLAVDAAAAPADASSPDAEDRPGHHAAPQARRLACSSLHAQLRMPMDTHLAHYHGTL